MWKANVSTTIIIYYADYSDEKYLRVFKAKINLTLSISIYSFDSVWHWTLAVQVMKILVGLQHHSKQSVWMYKFQQTMCESTKSLSVDNLQAVHHVDITNYSMGSRSFGLSEQLLECPRLWVEPVSILKLNSRPFKMIPTKQNMIHSRILVLYVHFCSRGFKSTKPEGNFNFKHYDRWQILY